MVDLSIIVVNYNTKKLTLDTIQSVYQSETACLIETIVVDNASKEEGLEEEIRRCFPEVTYLQNESNLGFSKANNRGIRIARGRYVLLLNSDTLLERDTLQIMIHYMDNHPRVGASGCKVVLPDGSLDKACKRGFPTPEASFYYMTGFHAFFPKHPRFNQYQLSHLDPNKEQEVDSLVGAFMLVRREAFEQVGLLDEEFFMYGEDIDWCYRIKRGGWDIMYYPAAKILHIKGASSRKKTLKVIYEFHRAMFLFYKKHYKEIYPKPVTVIVYAGIGSRLFLSILFNKLKVNPW